MTSLPVHRTRGLPSTHPSGVSSGRQRASSPSSCDVTQGVPASRHTHTREARRAMAPLVIVLSLLLLLGSCVLTATGCRPKTRIRIGRVPEIKPFELETLPKFPDVPSYRDKHNQEFGQRWKGKGASKGRNEGGYWDEVVEEVVDAVAGFVEPEDEHEQQQDDDKMAEGAATEASRKDAVTSGVGSRPEYSPLLWLVASTVAANLPLQS